MKNLLSSTNFQTLLAVLMLTLVSLTVTAKNLRMTTKQVTTTVNVEQDYDYVITGETPFGENGIVNIVNTEHAVVIINAVKPTAVIKNWLNKVQINGEKAVNNLNCQVKLYNRGTIIMPYSRYIQPLTVYSEKNFEGEAVSDFGLENDGGFMNTLTDKQLNNKIRSFKLKRGYMVTFSLLPAGRGYSRCFIAAAEDLEVAELPMLMDQRISSYRVFKWYDTGKQHLAAAGGDFEACRALNVTSTYTWGGTSEMAPDIENVPHHIKENDPSPSDLGACTSSPHMKTNNEPMNPDDDPKGQTESVDLVLSNWQDLMRTGMRLCSPSSWDGSDYTDGTGYIKRFIDSIDARGWRCDIIDLHCYWPESKFGTIRNWTNSTHRPVWISEWVWGSSWNNEGIFREAQGNYRDNPTNDQLNKNKEVLTRICATMNANDCIERYYYWNGEANCSKVYRDGKLTPAGEMYAALDGGVGYNGKYDYIPNTPPQYGPSKFAVNYSEGTAVISWRDSNGEMNRSMTLEQKPSGGQWVKVADIEQKEQAANYSYTIENAAEGTEYRVVLIDVNGKKRLTSEDLQTGDAVQVEDKDYYAGGNKIVNGDFDFGLTGWYGGTEEPLKEPAFQVVTYGGYGSAPYLQAHLNGTAASANSIKTVFEVEKQKNYVFVMAGRHLSNYVKLSLTTDGTEESQVLLEGKESQGWERSSIVFNSGNYDKVVLKARWLGAVAQLDGIELRELFATREEAVADGVAKGKLMAEAYKSYYPNQTKLNAYVDNSLAAITTTDDDALEMVENLTNDYATALDLLKELAITKSELEGLTDLKCVGYDEMAELVKSAEAESNVKTMNDIITQLKAKKQKYMTYHEANVQPKSPSFADTEGWETKVGTYTGGDQRKNSRDGKTFWNAWWSISKAQNPNATMEIRQKVTVDEPGFYVMECKATTEHFCLSDQHGYMKAGDKTVVTPNLSYDYYDLPVMNVWETLTTAPMYLEAGTEVTIGFVGSKNGATDGMYKAFGKTDANADNREGWWCATDFVLKYIPVFKTTTTAGKWSTICLPYTMKPAEGTKLYKIAGFSSDYTKVCLEEINETDAGVPCLYRAEKDDVLFYEYGESVASATDGAGNLRGYLDLSSTLTAGSYYIVDGERWERVGTSNRPKSGKYAAAIRPFTYNKWKKVDTFETWDETLTMPINGVTDEEKAINENALSISTTKAGGQKRTDGYYTLDGRKIGNAQVKPGLYIKVADGSTMKVLVK